MNFQIYRLQKAWLDRCLLMPISEHPLTVKTVKGPKHSKNMDNSTFLIFVYPYKENLVRKYLI